MGGGREWHTSIVIDSGGGRLWGVVIESSG